MDLHATCLTQGDSQATSEAATLNFDMRQFYEKWLQDMRDDQSFNCRRQLPGNATCGALADVTVRAVAHAILHTHTISLVIVRYIWRQLPPNFLEY